MTDTDRPHGTSGSSGASRDLVRHLPAALLVVLLIAFVADNTRRVTIGFVVTDRRMPLIFVLLMTALAGAAVGWLLSWRRRR